MFRITRLWSVFSFFIPFSEMNRPRPLWFEVIIRIKIWHPMGVSGRQISSWHSQQKSLELYRALLLLSDCPLVRSFCSSKTVLAIWSQLRSHHHHLHLQTSTSSFMSSEIKLPTFWRRPRNQTLNILWGRMMPWRRPSSCQVHAVGQLWSHLEVR